MASTKFADAVKPAKDLLSKSYNYNTKVEITTAAPNGVSLSSEVVLSKPASALVKGSASSGDFKLDKLQVGSDKKIVLETSMKTGLPGTTVSFKASDGTRAAGADAVTAVLGVVHTDKLATVTLDVDALKYSADSSVVFNYDGFMVGGQGKASLKGDKGLDLSDYNVLVGYKASGLTAAVVTDKKASGVTAGVHSKVNSTMDFAAVAKFPLAFKQASAFDVEAGLAYKASADTTIHGKANSNGKVAVSYKQVLNSFATVTFAGELDAANIGSDEHKFGINIAYTA